MFCCVHFADLIYTNHNGRFTRTHHVARPRYDHFKENRKKKIRKTRLQSMQRKPERRSDAKLCESREKNIVEVLARRRATELPTAGGSR